jgi:hypothetical protein
VRKKSPEKPADKQYFTIPKQYWLPAAASALSLYPASQAEQSTSPSPKQSVPPLPLLTVGVPLGHVHVAAEGR